MINLSRTSFILAVIILLAILAYARMPRALVTGALYLVIASSLDLIGILLGVGARKVSKQESNQGDAWQVQVRSNVLISLAWQFAIMGLLNIWAYGYPITTFICLLCFVSVIIFIFLSYKQVGLADNPHQYGGGKLLNYFGQRRSRRLLFIMFFVYPASPFLAAGLALFLRRHRYPIAVDPPNLCMMAIALASLVSAAMVFHRYKDEPRHNQLKKSIFIIIAASLIITTLLVFVVNYSWRLYSFSAITTSLLAAIMYYLFSARAGSEVTS